METNEPNRLAVHTVRIHHDRGDVRERHSVACPRMGRSVSADACFQCSRLAGVSLDPSKSRYELSCYAEAEAPVPAADAIGGKVPITAIMTRDVHCVAPTAKLQDVRRVFLEHDISGAPVVDDFGRPLGVVTKTDLLRAIEEKRGKRVIDVMTGFDYSLRETATIAEAAALMAFESIHRLPVISAEGQVVGIVASIDVLRFIGETTGYLR